MKSSAPSSMFLSHHTRVTVRAADQKVTLRHDLATRLITLTWKGHPAHRTVLPDDQAFALACAISVHRRVTLDDHTLPLTRDQAHRLARILRSMHYPAAESVTYQSAHGQPFLNSSAPLLCVSVTRQQSQGWRSLFLPRSGQDLLMATRAAWRSTFHALSLDTEHDLFHRRISHINGLHRQYDVDCLYRARVFGLHFTLAEICANEHVEWRTLYDPSCDEGFVGVPGEVLALPCSDQEAQAVSLTTPDAAPHERPSQRGVTQGRRLRVWMTQLGVRFLNALR